MAEASSATSTAVLTVSERIGTFPFLSLPPEIRVMIYRLLAPDNEVLHLAQHVKTYHIRKPLRHDGLPCCPAILRLNRAVYAEAIVEFYAHARFLAEIKRDVIQIFGLKVTRSDPMPSGFFLVRSLSLKLTPVSDEFIPGSQQPLKPPRYLYVGQPDHEMLNFCFPPSFQSYANLRHIKVVIHVTGALWAPYLSRNYGYRVVPDRPDRVSWMLYRTLHALQNLRRLLKPRVVIEYSGHFPYQYNLSLDYLYSLGPNPLSTRTKYWYWHQEFHPIVNKYAKALERILAS